MVQEIYAIYLNKLKKNIYESKKKCLDKINTVP